MGTRTGKEILAGGGAVQIEQPGRPHQEDDIWVKN